MAYETVAGEALEIEPPSIIYANEMDEYFPKSAVDSKPLNNARDALVANIIEFHLPNSILLILLFFQFSPC